MAVHLDAAVETPHRQQFGDDDWQYYQQPFPLIVGAYDGHHLNIPRLMAGVQQALAAPAAPAARRSRPWTPRHHRAARGCPRHRLPGYLYRLHGEFARWIDNRFDVVAKPGQRIGRAPQAGDVLLQVRLGRIHLGRCIVLGDRDHRLAATPPKLAPGQLLLRPRRRAALTEPLPVELARPLRSRTSR